MKRFLFILMALSGLTVGGCDLGQFILTNFANPECLKKFGFLP